MQKCFNVFTYYPRNFNAQQYFTRFNEVSALVKNFTKISNTPEFVPMQGDICVFKSVDNIGHISIATGEGNTSYFTVMTKTGMGIILLQKNATHTIIFRSVEI